ncbi:MAG: ATP-dependent DNA helicase RecG, partial [Monoglobaceae bacterium]
RTVGSARDCLKLTLENKNTNEKVDVMWFHQLYKKDFLDTMYGQKVLCCGRLSKNVYNKSFYFANPQVFTSKITDDEIIFPVYSKITGMSDDYFKKTLDAAISKISVSDYLDEQTRKEFRLCEYNGEYFRKIHQPKSQDEINECKRRKIFDDLFYFASKLYTEANEQTDSPFKANSSENTYKILGTLPFELTDDQKNVMSKIKARIESGKRLNALVQGDVGSGKTIVAFFSMLLMAENGYQSVLMAPTKVLAEQHYADLCKLCEGSIFEGRIVYLSSGMKTKERREKLEKIANGDALLIIGTHSVLSETINYWTLGLVVVDEEHKFGVVQREQLAENAEQGVHMITMSATPIPRSLASVLYGANKDIFTISQLPNGRKPVITNIIEDDNKIFEFVKSQIKQGRQAYIVCPLIDNETSVDAKSVEDEIKDIELAFVNEPEINIASVTGKTKTEDAERILNDFKDNKIQILISTTVIEVGVNVPNATVMVIRDAQRFGLSQLHQLRGRVGRGNYQSYCILSSHEKDNSRLNVMCETNDGFKIAEADLKNRGTGDLLGTLQSGQNRYVELALLYPKFYEKVKRKVQYLISQKNILR